MSEASALQPTRRSFVKGAFCLAGATGAMSGLGAAYAAEAGPQEDSVEQELSFTPGTYTGTGIGKHGDIVVEATFSDSSIDQISIVRHAETEDLSDVALKVIPLAIIANQSLDVDVVSGATLSSRGLIAAVTDAAEQAGGAAALEEAPCTYEAVQNMVPGTYTGTAYGKWKAGDSEGTRHGAPSPIEATQVEVTVDETSIVSVNVLTCSDTPGFQEAALERTPADIVAQQSIYVDTVTGATMTSAAITSATCKALEQAGADLVGFAKATPKVEETETYDADLVIVGAGLTGTSAALRASELGLKTVIIEKTNRVSGTGGCSSGPFALQSKLALDAGLDMTFDEAFALRMEEDKGRTNAALVDKVFRNTPRVIDWLQEKWVNIGERGMDVEPSVDPMLIYAYYGIGTQKWQNLYDNYILPAGGTLLFETTVKDFDIDDEGRVTTVYAKKQDGTEVVVNCKAMVVATGGFGGNDAMMQEYFNCTCVCVGLSSNDGAGINLLLKKGFRLSDDVAPSLAEFCSNDVIDYYSSYMKLINQVGFLQLDPSGDRFMDEELCITESNSIGAAALRRATWAWVILTEADLESLCTKGIRGHLSQEYCDQWEIRPRIVEPIYDTLRDEMNRAIELGQAFKADTLDELGELIGFDEVTYKSAIENYKAAVAAGEDPLFGKDPRLLYPLDEGPFYAVRIIPVLDTTYNGIRVNTKFQPLDHDLKPSVKGLYVAGMDSGGYFTYPYSNFLGSCSNYCLNSGMLSVDAAAEYLGITE